MLLGIVAVLLLLGIFIFGPWELPGFGQLSQRQQGQESLAAEGLWPPPGDTDKDGFTDIIEKWIKTDPADNCADDARDAAWPPDLNNDKKVDKADTDAFKPYFFSKVGETKFNPRFDLNADKTINIMDINILKPYFGASCPFHFLKATPSGSKVTFNWTPDANSGVQVRIGDMTKDSAFGCNEAGYRAYFTADQTSLSSAEAGPSSNLIAGHKYCAVMYVQSSVSNFLEFIMP